MLKESGITDTSFVFFCKLTPIWLEEGFIEVNISFSNVISRTKPPIKCYKMLQTTLELHLRPVEILILTACRNSDSFYCMLFLFLLGMCLAKYVFGNTLIAEL